MKKLEPIEDKYMKVYCDNCEHLYQEPTKVFYECHNKKNEIVKDNWFNKQRYREKKPSELNKNNDCKWYKESEG